MTNFSITEPNGIHHSKHKPPIIKLGNPALGLNAEYPNPVTSQKPIIQRRHANNQSIFLNKTIIFYMEKYIKGVSKRLHICSTFNKGN